MDDNARIAENTDLIRQSDQAGSQKLLLAVKVANEIEDSEYRTSYIAAIAEHLAKIGGLNEIERAAALVRPTRAIDQWSAFKAIADRLMAEKQYERALAF